MLNDRAHEIVEGFAGRTGDLRVQQHRLSGGARVFDFGVDVHGGLEAGLLLARTCMSGLGEVRLVPGDIDGVGWPHVAVRTDAPVDACLLSQYAGWQVAVGPFFAMGSGPVRAAAAREDLFERLNYRERAERAVGVLEGSTLPDDSVVQWMSERTGVAADRITLLIAPTASQAGNLQVVARSVETALHKLFELGFDVGRVRSGFGIAPLAPVAADDLTGIGRSNDAILYGGRVTLWVVGDDESLQQVGPQVPSAASGSYGKPFLDLFEEAGRDFYKIDPLLFSPAEVVFQNLDTGRVHRFGNRMIRVLRDSFGL